MIDPIPVPPFTRGMTNRRAAVVIGTEADAGLLRGALNVDLRTEGSLQRRAGYTKILAAQVSRSIWHPAGKPFIVLAAGSEILRMDEGGQTEVLVSGVSAAARVAFADVNGSVYWTDGIRCGSLFDESEWSMPWVQGQATEIDGAHLLTMPPGRHICFHNNRLYVARGSMLYISEPFMPAFYDPASGYEAFPADIVMLAQTSGAVFVGADKTYMATDGFPAQALVTVDPQPPLEYSCSYDSERDRALWIGARGLTIGLPSGEVSRPQEALVAVARSAIGATVARNRDGMRHDIAVLHDPEVTAAQASSYINARLVRKET